MGQTSRDARKTCNWDNLSLEASLKWAAIEVTPLDIILMESGSNSFELCKRLGNLGLKACVLESCHAGKHIRTYADNNKMAAARTTPTHLAGNAPRAWANTASTRNCLPVDFGAGGQV